MPKVVVVLCNLFCFDCLEQMQNREMHLLIFVFLLDKLDILVYLWEGSRNLVVLSPLIRLSFHPHHH